MGISLFPASAASPLPWHASELVHVLLTSAEKLIPARNFGLLLHHQTPRPGVLRITDIIADHSPALEG
jgi:hypothetical protein